MSKDLIRKPGSVFVSVNPPKPVRIPNVTHIGERFKSWVNVATEIVSEATPEPEAQPTPERGPQTRSEPERGPHAPLGDPTDVRIYRRESSGKQTKIWEGSAPHNIDAWCQSQADTSGCLITMYDAESVKHFHPENPIVNDDAPPISDSMKSDEPKPKTHLQDLVREIDVIMGVV